MKLTKDQKSVLKYLKELAKDFKVEVIQIDEVVTIAWVRNFATAKMITVSTSYFDRDETDRFRKSTGEYFALSRMFVDMAETMQLPFGEYDNEQIQSILEDMFVI